MHQSLKKIKLFQKTPLFLQEREKKVRNSWEILSIFTVRIFENHTTETLPVEAILKTMKKFPKNTHVNLQSSPKFKLFENSQVIIPVETHSIKSLPKKAFLENCWNFFQTISVIFPKNQFFECFSHSYAIGHSETQSRKSLTSLELLKTFKEFFGKKHHFFPKIPFF